MKVVEIATQADPARVMAEYEAAYEETHGLTPKAIANWAQLVRDSTPVREGFVVEIKCVVEDSGEMYFDVSGRHPTEEQRYGLSISPWGEWREMEVEDLTEKNLTLEQLAAHLLYEMTWHGWPEQIEAFRDSLNDMAEQVDRDLASGTPLEELGYKEWKPGELGELGESE